MEAYLTLLYFFLPLVLVGVAGGHSCLSAARRVAWRRDIPWVLRVYATESLHRLLGLSLALQPEYLVLYARRAGWFMGIRVMCQNHLTCCCLMCCRTGFAPTMSRIILFLILSRLVYFTAFSSISFHKWPVFSRGLLLVTSVLKTGTPVATLPGIWHDRVSAGTGWPGVSRLWLGEIESLIYNFYLSVAARNIEQIHSPRYTRMLLGC